ncbi:hypothetical protein G6F56_004809 [Rhizopus delemar]|nr:hypothetical protein G6F56_004809 [Rhizopus delemar]
MPDQTSCSIYDTLPTLDIWYETKPTVQQENKKRTCLVSFSPEPPLIHRYETRPVMERRSSSSESVKLFLKHYKSKLTRHRI